MTQDGGAADKLAKAVDDYLSEHDTPAPDYSYRRVCRERMRKALHDYRAKAAATCAALRAAWAENDRLRHKWAFERGDCEHQFARAGRAEAKLAEAVVVLALLRKLAGYAAGHGAIGNPLKKDLQGAVAAADVFLGSMKP